MELDGSRTKVLQRPRKLYYSRVGEGVKGEAKREVQRATLAEIRNELDIERCVYFTRKSILSWTRESHQHTATRSPLEGTSSSFFVQIYLLRFILLMVFYGDL